jgi:putative oxidoreductase
MTMTYSAAPTRSSGFMIFIQSIASLLLRFALALPFWKSGMTRWDGFLSLRPATVYFYQELYKPTIFGKTYSIPFPEITAWFASFAELILPAALVIGFATRLSALGLLIMTLVIYTTYQSLGASPSQWQTETLPWGALALALIAYGPGRISFDYFIARGFGRA